MLSLIDQHKKEELTAVIACLAMRISNLSTLTVYYEYRDKYLFISVYNSSETILSSFINLNGDETLTKLTDACTTLLKTWEDIKVSLVTMANYYSSEKIRIAA